MTFTNYTDCSGDFTLQDTLGRAAISSSGFGSTGNTLTISGLQQPYSLTWNNTSQANAPIGTKIILNNACASFGGWAGTLNVVSSIQLPNGQKFSFAYDPKYALLSQVTYPSGAYISYSWQNNPLSAAFSYSLAQGGGADTCSLEYDTFAVAHRYVYNASKVLILQQDFSYSPTTWNSDGITWGVSGKQTTVTTTDKVTGLISKTMYTYSPISLPRPPYVYSGLAPQIPLEQQIVYKDGNNNILRTVKKGWVNQFELSSEQTVLENGLTSETDYTYGPGAVVTEKDEYDYGTAARGSLLRKTITNYQTFANTPMYPSGPSIFNRPCQTITYDQNNNRVAETDNYYDSGTTLCGTPPKPTLPGTGNYTSHDETYYGTTATVPRGNLTQKVVWASVGASPTTTYVYDETGQLTSTKDPCGNTMCSDMTGTSHTTTYSYTDGYTVLSGGSNVTYTPSVPTNARLTKITDPLGHTAQFTYDFNNGQLTKSTDANSQSTTYIYNDAFARPTIANYSDGGQMEYVYNDAPPAPSVTSCQLINGAQGATCSPTSPPPGWKTTVAVMDGMGHVVQTQLVSDPDGITYSATTYDGSGRTYTATNPYRTTGDSTYGVTTQLYDALGRPCLVVPPDFAASAPATCPTTAPAGETFTSYSGNLTTVTDEIGNQRTNQTDGLGRLTAVWEAPNQTGYNFETQYQYDALNNLICAVQKGTDTTQFTSCATASATWRPRSFGYDSLSRLTSATNPESGTITYAYDLNSNLSSKVSPQAGQTGGGRTTTTYSYDVLNRPYQKTYANPAAPVVVYGYDGVAPTGCVAVLPPTISSPTNLVGRRSSMCAQYSASSWSFDPMGRPLIESRTNTGSANTDYSVMYGYYKDGSLNTLMYPSGDIVTYAVGNAGRATQLSDSANNYVGYTGNTATYAPPGSLASMTNGHTGTFAGIVTSNTYNDRLQPILLSASVGSSSILSLCYDFHLGITVNNTPCQFSKYTTGDNGNVFQVLNNVDATRSTAFQYDYLNRIKQANTVNTTSSNCWGETYTIDPWGNLTNRAAVSGMGGGCTTEPLNDAPATTKNQLNGPQYDAAGNVTNDGNGNQPTYDAENRISTDSGVTYAYDADGVRVSKSSGTMYWPGPGGETVTETNLAGTINEEYVYFNGQRIARVDRPSGTVHYYFSDRLDSASVVTSSLGTAPVQYFYYPYGGMQSSTGSDPNHYKFTSKERDSESGLDMFGARYYGSSLGRFMTPDWAAKPTAVPYANFGNPQSLNLYSYVENNPTTTGDPDGHWDPGVEIAMRVALAVSSFVARHPDVATAADKVSQSLSMKVSGGVGVQTPKSLPVVGSATGTAYVGGSKDGLNVGININGTAKAGPLGGQVNVDVPVVKDGGLVNPIKNSSADFSPVLGAEHGKLEGDASANKEETTIGGTYGEGIVGGGEIGAATSALTDLGRAVFDGIATDVVETLRDASKVNTMPPGMGANEPAPN